MGRKLKDLCRTCGGRCCRCFSGVLLTKEDDANRLEILGATVEDDRKLGLIILCPGNTCPFLKDGRCSIYSERPAACQEFDCTHPKRLENSVVFEDFPELRGIIAAEATK